MNGEQDRASVRLEPHPADERLAILRVERPPVNAFDQAMWDLFEAVTATLHASTTYRAVVITGGRQPTRRNRVSYTKENPDQTRLQDAANQG